MRYKGRKIRLFILFMAGAFLACSCQWNVYALETGDALINMLNPDTEDVAEKGLISGDEPGDILVIYPVLTTDSVSKSVSAIAQVYTSLGDQVDYCSDKYASQVVDSYDSIVWLLPDPSDELAKKMKNYQGRVLLLGNTVSCLKDIPEAQIETVAKGNVSADASYTYTGDNTFHAAVKLSDATVIRHAEYTSGNMLIDGQNVPLVMGCNGVRYIALQEYQNNFAKAVLMQETVLWQWPYHDLPHEYSEYVVIDNIYPFTDPDRLLKIVSYLTKKNMNFVLAVMPIYDHSNYPAMQQLCEVLKYVQAGNGAVILNAPIIQNKTDPEELQDKLTEATLGYWSNGVYPLALSIPSDWIYDTDLHDTLGRYRTLFVHDTDAFTQENIADLSTRNFLTLGSQLITPAIGLDYTGIGYVDYCATAVYLDVGMDDEDLYNAIDAAGNSRVPLQNLKDMNHVVYMNKSNVMKWDGRVMLVNGERVDLEYRPTEYPENFDYQRSVYYRATADLANQNHLLIIFSLFVLLVFALMAILARKQMHRRFLYRGDK